jgi:Na+/H+-dicarboxylate symporter
MSGLLKKMSEKFALVLFLSAVVGLILGLLLGDKAEYIKPLGTIFTRLLSMVVPVLVFFSISSAFANIGNAKKLSKWAGKVIGWFIFTTVIGCIIGIVMGLIFKPGLGIGLPGGTDYEVTQITADMFIDWLPENAVGALAEGNTIQIVFLSIFVGIAAVCLPEGKSKDTVLGILNALQDLTLKIVQGIMYYAPIGICCLMASSISSLKGAFLQEMGSFLIAVTIGFALHIVLCYFGALKLMAKISPIRFTKKLFPALITAFTTTSSAGTMPVTLRCVKEIGCSDEIADFGIPLGVTFNMDSMAVEIPLYIMLGMFAIGQSPTVPQLFLFALMGVAFSVGCAGVPGGGLAIAVILINAFNLPVEVVGWIAAIFFYLDITGTTINIWGDAVCTTIVAKSEGMFDMEKFNS